MFFYLKSRIFARSYFFGSKHLIAKLVRQSSVILRTPFEIRLEIGSYMPTTDKRPSDTACGIQCGPKSRQNYLTHITVSHAVTESHIVGDVNHQLTVLWSSCGTQL